MGLKQTGAGLARDSEHQKGSWGRAVELRVGRQQGHIWEEASGVQLGWEEEQVASQVWGIPPGDLPVGPSSPSLPKAEGVFIPK